MSRMLFDFECVDGHGFEALVKKDTLTTYCRICHKTANKVLSAPHFKLEGWSGSFPSRASRWDRDHEVAGAKGRERKREEAFYTPANPHSLF